MEEIISYFRAYNRKEELILKGEVKFESKANIIILRDTEGKAFKHFELNTQMPEYVIKNDRLIIFAEEDVSIHLLFNKNDSSECHLYKTIVYSLEQLKTEKVREKEKSETAKKFIIKEPKSFQKEMLEYAKQSNTIIFLETGLGKTYIAIMLLKHMFGEPLENNFNNRAYYEKTSPKKSLFLCKTIGLLIQQAKVLKYNTNLKIFKLYGGTDRMTMPTQQKFRKNIEKYDVIVGSSESVYKYFTLGYFKKDEFNLAIFDECHHCKSDDFYNTLLKHFLFQTNDQAKILGLTASPSDDNNYEPEKLQVNIQTLSNNMNSNLYVPSNILNNESINSHKKFVYEEYEEDGETIRGLYHFIFNEFIFPLVDKYINQIEANVFKDKNSEFLFYASLLLLGSTDKKEQHTEKINWIFNSDDYKVLEKLISDKSGAYFNSEKKEIFEKLFLNPEERQFNFYLEFSQTIKKILKNKFLESMVNLAKYSSLLLTCINGESLRHMLTKYGDDIIECYPKLHSLVREVLRKMELNTNLAKHESKILNHLLIQLSNMKKESGSKIIVFTKFRVTAFFLNRALNKNLETFSALIMGYNSKNFMSFSEKDLSINLERFKDPDSKCDILISTDVAEEGIDIPQCNRIIHLDRLETIKSYIQKNGRGRKLDTTIHLFVQKNKRPEYEKQIKNIELGIVKIKEIVKDGSVKPKYTVETYIENFHYFETSKGARVYLSYAKKLINEFVSRLEFDGYSWLREDFKVEEKYKDGQIRTNTTKFVNPDKNNPVVGYRPYLYLSSLIEIINKIYDTEEWFDSHKLAIDYTKTYKDHYYLKAIKTLHYHQYFNDNLMFIKQNDDLIYVGSENKNIPAEPIFSIKPNIEIEQLTYYCHVFDMNPNFIDINHESPLFKDKQAAFICNFTTCNDFDLFIRRNELIKLYFYNKTQTMLDDDQKKREEELIKSKPKLRHEFYNNLNVKFNQQFLLKITQKEKDLIDFFNTFQMYFIADAECSFYFNLYQKKFAFSYLFETEHKYLKDIFENRIKKDHFKDILLEDNNANFTNDVIKFVILKKHTNAIHYEYLDKIVLNVKKDIIYYSKFLKKLTMTKDSYTEKEFKETSNEFIEETLKPNLKGETILNTISRNLINFTKNFIFLYSEKNIKGTFRKKGCDMTFHEFYLSKYGLITMSDKDYLRTKLLDFNVKMFKYRVNLVAKRDMSKFKEKKLMKKFNYLPSEIMYRIDYISLDELFFFSLVPILTHKIQNNVKYFYHAKCLNDEFKFITSEEKVNINLLIQALNSKTTLEAQNYERLEFLGDSVLKFLSSWEVFKQHPIGNKDLLCLKRRLIENNDNLFDKAYQKKLYQYLNTSQLSFKNVREKSEARLFNVQSNRAFSKLILKKESKKEENIIEEEVKGTNMIEAEEERKPKKKLMDNDYTESLVDDKFAFNIEELGSEATYSLNNERCFSMNYIKNVCDKIEVKESHKERVLPKKTLADLVESLVGFMFITKENNHEGLESASKFLKKLSILQDVFNLDQYTEEFWLKDLENKKCFRSQEYHMKKFEHILKIYPFNNKILLYQAFQHPSIITVESISGNSHFVTRSYQRLSFLGEALISMIISHWVYRENPYLDVNESMLHKLKICGINHHIISLMSLDLGFEKAILCWSKELESDLDKYREKMIELRKTWENIYRIKKEDFEKLDIEYTVILCELFYSFWGAMLLDTKNISLTIDIFLKFSEKYLNENATLDNYSQHPKVDILELFFERRYILKEIKENGFNRLKFGKKEHKENRKCKIFHYQLIINKLIIYEDDVEFNRAAITKAQSQALVVFKKLCAEIDERSKLSMNQKYFDVENILKRANISYRYDS